MSKRKQTENLHLYAYELTTGLPTFLKDWSDNMAILDGAHSAVLGAINALDDRLTTAEGTIEDLSPESIEDYKIRLDALEKKVVVNTNSIKDVNTRINTINAQINSINSEQAVQNGKISALETLTASHTQLISGLRTDLTGIDGRVTTLEQCCENVQREIADLQSDVDGFNQDITILTGQIETLSNAVTVLTDLVNSLQLDVLRQRLETIESNITAIQTEIGDSDYSPIASTISGSLVELKRQIDALTPEGYEELIEQMALLNTRMTTLETLLNSKADASSVANLCGVVATNSSTISTLQHDAMQIRRSIEG